MRLHGLIAEFEHPEQLLEAAHEARRQGYRSVDAFAPFPLEGLDRAIGFETYGVQAWMFVGGVLGALVGFFMQYYAHVGGYFMNIGGRPLNSWPAFVIITFELTVLFSSLFGFVAVLALNRLPKVHHPVFEVPGFERASIDRFFLVIEADDLRFEEEGTRKFLESLDPLRVVPVAETEAA
jgi:hypothetical protein